MCTSFILPRPSVVIAGWIAKNRIKTVVTVVSDDAPGADAERSFAGRFKKVRGQIAEAIKAPLVCSVFALFAIDLDG